MSKRRGKRRGTKPTVTKSSSRSAELTEAEQDKITRSSTHEYVSISFRFLQDDWGFQQLDEKQLRSFLLKWEKRSRLTWKELSEHRRHGLGKENIPAKKIKPRIPRPFRDVETFQVYRHHENLPVVGWKHQNVFCPIWIEAKYNDLYDHGS